MVSPGKLDLVLRLADTANIEALDRCLFSVAMQDYAPVTVHLLHPGLSGPDLSRVADTVAPTMSLNPAICLEPEQNRELAAVTAGATGRYLAFLDQHDVVQPWGYQALITELAQPDRAIAFGTVMDKFERRLPHACITVGQRRCRPGDRLAQFFGAADWRASGVVLDRTKIAAPDLALAPPFTEYDLILRLCAKYRSSFGRAQTIVVDRYWSTSDRPASQAGTARARIAASEVSAEVQRSIGLDPAPGRTVADLAEAFDPFR